MRILFQSYAFYPSCGGIESSALLLIREFLKLGHEVRVQTQIPLGEHAELDLEGVRIIRNPGLRQVLADAAWADVVYQHNPSLRLAAMLMLKPFKPVVVSIHTWLRRSDGSLAWPDRLKQLWIAGQSVIANSRATADHLQCPSTIIENAYDSDAFGSAQTGTRHGMAFVGRLVSDKGIRTALEAVKLLQDQGLCIPLTIIGDGDERTSLESYTNQAGLSESVTFVGRKSAPEVAEILNTCQYLVVPSLWEEPFGIVALEGIACGCIPIGTDHGGLVDAIGSCGPLFPPGDASTLAQLIQNLEQDAAYAEAFRANHATHLEQHSPETIALQHLAVFEQAVQRTTQS